jgi:anti-anti-sigma factor
MSEWREGDPVEVATRFTGAWAGGFEVVSRDGDRWRLRRVSDGAVLPVEFTEDELRAEPRSRAGVRADLDQPNDTTARAADHVPVVRLRFPQDLDLAAVELLGPAMLDAIEHAEHEVVLDLTDTAFLDSYGIRLLVRVRRAAWARDLRVRVDGARPLVAALLDLVGVNPHFHPDLDQSSHV